MNGLFGGFLGLVHTIGEHVLIAIIYVAVGKKLPEDADVRYIVTCTRKITPKRWRESTKMKTGDFCYEENIYRRANREYFTRF
jgi:hypothetical protein